MSQTIEYRVGLGARLAHLYEVEARFPVAAGPVDLRMAVWTPGSYLVREYERHVQELACTDGEGRPLPVRKVEKAAWRVEAEAATTLVARYRVYAHEVTVRTSHLDASHAYWNGACLYLYVDSLRANPARVTLAEVPDGWRATTSLARDAAGGFLAANFDELVDSPFEVGPHEEVAVAAAGKPLVFARWGRVAPGPHDFAGFTRDVAKIVEAHAAIFGGVPYERFAFLLHFVPNAHGGLEHAASSTCLGSSHAFASDEKYQDLLELCSHEFFHLWNVKRIHPEALGPFDYAREAHTRSLWVVEGWTSYYDRLGLRRANLILADRYRARLGEELTRLAAIPGRRRQSLEESSFDAWIKLYRPDENSVNSTVSYYLKGSIVALLLDLEIRRRTGGARSLDDALRALWRDYGQRGRGYPDAAVQPLVEEAAGVALGDFFDAAVRGRGELDLDGPLASVGLAAKATPLGAGDDGEPKAWLGANLAQEGDRLRVTEVLAGSPAERGGLCPGDQIVALDGFRVDKEALGDRLAARRPGDAPRFTLFRRDELAELAVALGATTDEAAPRKYEIVFADGAPPEARAAYQSWLLDEWGKKEEG